MTFRAGANPKLITSAKQIEKLASPGRWRDHTERGLYLQIINANNRSWILRYQILGKARAVGLGAYPLIGLREAREKAREMRRKLLDGVDPIEERRAHRAAMQAERAKALTFAEAVNRYYNAKACEWKERQRAAFLATLKTYALPIIGGLEVADIGTPDVLCVLEPIWRTKPATASILRARIEKVLAWAQVSGFRSADNCARWRGHLKEVLASHSKIAKTEHHEAMPYAEIPRFMAQLRAIETVTARTLEFIVLTAPRKAEATNATWNEFDFDKKIWTIPASRMKGGSEHRVPLCDDVIALLQKLPRETDNPHVFVGAKARAPISVSSLDRLLRTMGRSETVHGFRSSLRDWAGDRTEFPREVAEAALAHKVGNEVERTYRRGDALEKRRELMTVWARYCAAGEDHKGEAEDHKGELIEFRGRAK